MKRIMMFILTVLLLTITGCTSDDLFKPIELTEEMQLEADVNNLVHIGRINDVDLYRTNLIPSAYFMYGIMLKDKTGDESLSGAETYNFMFEYEGEIYYIPDGLNAGLFTLSELYQAKVYVGGCSYPVKTLEELQRLRIDIDNIELSDDVCQEYFKKCLNSTESSFSIKGFDFYLGYNYQICYAHFTIIVDGYYFGSGGCGDSLNELGFIAVKDGYAYELQELVDSKQLLTYEIYMSYMSFRDGLE